MDKNKYIAHVPDTYSYKYIYKIAHKQTYACVHTQNLTYDSETGKQALKGPKYLNEISSVITSRPFH